MQKSSLVVVVLNTSTPALLIVEGAQYFFRKKPLEQILQFLLMSKNPEHSSQLEPTALHFEHLSPQ